MELLISAAMGLAIVAGIFLAVELVVVILDALVDVEIILSVLVVWIFITAAVFVARNIGKDLPAEAPTVEAR